MQSKHVVFAVLITIFCAGAVIAAISGLSETIRATNTAPNISITPITTPPVQAESIPPQEPANASTTEAPTNTIISTSTTQNDTQTASTTGVQ